MRRLRTPCFFMLPRHHDPDGTEGWHGGNGGPLLPQPLWCALPDCLNGVGHAGGGHPAPLEEQAKASALDALFFEGISKGGPWMLRCWWVKGCRRPQDNAEMGVALP
jgi:hypothetical protein